MKTPSKRAPKTLPPAVRDLVAEGGNVLTTDDVPATNKETVEGSTLREPAIGVGQTVPRVPKS